MDGLLLSNLTLLKQIHDNSNTGGKGVDVKDAYISKAFKGFGKLYFGNAKSAGGMWKTQVLIVFFLWKDQCTMRQCKLSHRAGLAL